MHEQNAEHRNKPVPERETWVPPRVQRMRAGEAEVAAGFGRDIAFS